MGNAEPVSIADEVPFEIPESWEWVRLQTVCTKLVDGDHNPPKGEVYRTDYIMASSTNINQDRLVDLEKVRYLSAETFLKENERTSATIGDIFFTSVGSLGRSCIFDGSLNICFQRSVSVITTLLFNEYLKYCFDSGYFQRAILMNLADLVENVGITDEEMEQLLYQVRTETTENIMNMEKEYEGWTGKKSDSLPWRDFARKKILAAFGHDDCGTTIRRLCYVEHVTVDPDLKQIVHDLTSQIATMNVFHPEKYPDLLAEGRKVDELWRIKTDDLGYFTVKG